MGHLAFTRRTLVLTYLVWLGWTTQADAAVAIVQSVLESSCVATTSCNVNFSGNVTGGNGVVVGVVRSDAPASVNFTCSDGTNGSYSVAVTQTSASTARQVTFCEKRNLTGGFTQVTINADVSATYFIYMYELSGLSNVLSPLTGSNDDSAQINHTCSTSGLNGTGFGICIGANSAGNAPTFGGSYTMDNTSVFLFAARGIQTWASEQGNFTSSSENYVTALMIMREPDPAGVDLALRGVGR